MVTLNGENYTQRAAGSLSPKITAKTCLKSLPSDLAFKFVQDTCINSAKEDTTSLEHL